MYINDIIILNAVLYVISFVFTFYREGYKITIKSYLLLIWAISGVVSIYYYNYGIRNYRNITIIPFIYLFVLVLLSFYPILTFNYKNVKHIVANNFFIQVSIIFIACISIEPFIENFFQVLKTVGKSSGDYITDVYEQKNSLGDSTEYLKLSWIGRKFNVINLWLKDFVPVLLMFYLTKDKKKKLIVIGLIIAILNPMLFAYVNAGRVTIVTQLMYLIFIYLLMSNCLVSKLRKQIVFYGSISFILIFCLVVAITLFRYLKYAELNPNTEFSIFDWLSLYVGEGMLNFNEYMWGINTTMQGDNSFSFFKSIAGLDTFTNYLERRAYWQPRTGISGMIFYTHIGDWYGDLGAVNTVVFVIVLVVLITAITRNKGQVISLHKFLLIAIWYKICLMGFTFYTYKTSLITLNLIFLLFIYIVLLFTKKPKVYIAWRKKLG